MVIEPPRSRVIAVTGAGQPVGAGVAAALASAGAAVALVGEAGTTEQLEADLERSGSEVLSVPSALAGRSAAESALATAREALGAITGVVHAAVTPVALERRELADVDDERWDTIWESTMRTTLGLLQAAHGEMRGSGGSILLVTPTLSMSGAPGLVAYTAAIEGQRLLAKSAARQWGPDRVRVNCLAPAPELVGAVGAAVSLAPPALGGPGDPYSDLGPVADFLLGDGARFVTGATICADGGVWMAP